MRVLSILFFLLLSIKSNGQIKECETEKLTFEINKYPHKDTLRDLILTINAYKFVKNLDNIVFTNKGISTLNYNIEGAEICFYKNDTTLIVRPNSYKWKFSYYKDSNLISKEFKCTLRPRQEFLVLLDNRIQVEGKNLIKYQYIDSLSFELKLEGYEKWHPMENFNFTITDLTATLVRDKRAISEKKFKLSKSFYVGDLLRKGRPGDHLIISYYPQWIKENNELSYMSCHTLLNYTLGSKK